MNFVGCNSVFDANCNACGIRNGINLLVLGTKFVIQACLRYRICNVGTILAALETSEDNVCVKVGRFYSRLLAWILSRVVGASIRFRFGGWKCIRDLMVEFKKGAVESVSVGEIKLSLRQSLVKLFGFISKDPKLKVLICDLEVVMRPSSRSTAKAKPKFLLSGICFP
ncbi:hypothetical protein ACFX2A_045286 [Malus domestica]